MDEIGLHQLDQLHGDVERDWDHSVEQHNIAEENRRCVAVPLSDQVPGEMAGLVVSAVPDHGQDCTECGQEDDDGEDDNDDLVDQSLHTGSLCADILGAVLSNLCVLAGKDDEAIYVRSVPEDSATEKDLIDAQRVARQVLASANLQIPLKVVQVLVGLFGMGATYEKRR